jgi:hypothetical protein
MGLVRSKTIHSITLFKISYDTIESRWAPTPIGNQARPRQNLFSRATRRGTIFVSACFGERAEQVTLRIQKSLRDKRIMRGIDVAFSTETVIDVVRDFQKRKAAGFESAGKRREDDPGLSSFASYVAYFLITSYIILNNVFEWAVFERTSPICGTLRPQEINIPAAFAS